ncbi:hypothetical protein [Nocardioides convexus]|uniref:hypothetical protein n=1 Tax=Nocardioides convexus TaxID=2712224 RepID=UPI002418AB56|nr:hypothetical protein [Nocardioides convexus]
MGEQPRRRLAPEVRRAQPDRGGPRRVRPARLPGHRRRGHRRGRRRHPHPDLQVLRRQGRDLPRVPARRAHRAWTTPSSPPPAR